MTLNDRDRAALAAFRRELAEKKRAALPGALAPATFENDDGADPKTAAMCKRYVDGFDRLAKRGLGLVFCGPVGCGKTWRAAQIANALMDRGRAVIFSDMLTLDREMRMDYGRGAIDVEARLRGAGLVVIDDLGAERSTAVMNESVYHVVEFLKSCRTPAIFTMNIDPLAALGDGDQSRARVYSRILETCKVVKLTGHDKRMPAAQRNRALFDEVLGVD